VKPMLKLVKSRSLQSYFQKESRAARKDDCLNPEKRPTASDPSRPVYDGRLDDCDRETPSDISWSTPISPTHGAMKKRKSPVGKGMDVWAHVGRIRGDLHQKYARRNANLQPYTHACFHCGSTLSVGWSKKNVGGDRLREGCWQTTVVLRHLRVCNMLPAETLAQLTLLNDGFKQVKLEKGLIRNSQVAMPIKLLGGEVVFSKSLDADIRQAAKVAIAITIMYSHMWKRAAT